MGHKPILGRILSIVFTLALTALPVATSGWARSGVVPQATLFNNPGWTLIDANPNDGKEYLWDDDDYRRHGGLLGCLAGQWWG